MKQNESFGVRESRRKQVRKQTRRYNNNKQTECCIMMMMMMMFEIEFVCLLQCKCAEDDRI